MAKKTNNDGLSDGQKIGIGVGITAAIAAAAGSYFLYGSKSASKNRKAVKSWALKAKAEVLERIEQAKEMTQDEYNEVIGAVTAAYAGAQNVSKTELAAFTKEMKEHWRTIEKAAGGKKKAAKKAVKKAAKKATKVAKKTAKKATGTAKKVAKKVEKAV